MTIISRGVSHIDLCFLDLYCFFLFVFLMNNILKDVGCFYLHMFMQSMSYSQSIDMRIFCRGQQMKNIVTQVSRVCYVCLINVAQSLFWSPTLDICTLCFICTVSLSHLLQVKSENGIKSLVVGSQRWRNKWGVHF